jgi:hypothetical protein
MPFLEIGFEGDFSGVTPVDIVVSPASSTRRLVKVVSVCNVDTIAHNIILRKSVGAGPTVRDLVRVLLQPGEDFQYDKLTILDNTNEKIVGLLGEAIATTNPTFDAAFADVS